MFKTTKTSCCSSDISTLEDSLLGDNDSQYNKKIKDIGKIFKINEDINKKDDAINLINDSYNTLVCQFCKILKNFQIVKI